MLLDNCIYKISSTRRLKISCLDIPVSGCVTIVGSNGSGKTSLAKALEGGIDLLEGSISNGLKDDDLVRISFEQQLQLIDEDFKLRNNDNNSDEEEKGITPRSLIEESAKLPQTSIEALCRRLNITHLLDQPYSILSSGEGRKVLIARAILANKNTLILDAPFEGLDVQTRMDLMNLCEDLYKSNKLLILIVNRYDEIPSFSDYIGIINECELVKFGEKSKIQADLEFMQLSHNETINNMSLPEAPDDCIVSDCPDPVIDMTDVVVRYQSRIIINKLTMRINKGEHWQFVGPNGAGKSTLISLITGDHPQGYSNNLRLFGIQRGSGETIWDIKKNIGFVSPSFHMAYRVNCNALSVILSGYFDSIGLYEKPGDNKILLAHEWLKVLGMDALANVPFNSLSYGQQRLLLIARALVKHPLLLILDEPLQGLDSMSRLLVKKFVEYLMKVGKTQIIFVSHHAEDAPEGITNILEFVPFGDTYTYNITGLKTKKED